MEFTYRPIGAWPGELARNRERSRFKASWNDTLSLLDRELRFLKGRALILQVAMEESEIRLDGKPRSNAKATHPGVILSFESRHGPLSYPCDRFDHWSDNVRAIALSLEHLRAVDRYGVTRRGEQYRGWQALPDKSSAAPTAQQAAAVLVRYRGGSAASLLTSAEKFRAVYRAAMMATHPDRGGTALQFGEVQAAGKVLEKHHGR